MEGGRGHWRSAWCMVDGRWSSAPAARIRCHAGSRSYAAQASRSHAVIGDRCLRGLCDATQLSTVFGGSRTSCVWATSPLCTVYLACKISAIMERAAALALGIRCRHFKRVPMTCIHLGGVGLGVRLCPPVRGCMCRCRSRVFERFALWGAGGRQPAAPRFQVDLLLSLSTDGR